MDYTEEQRKLLRNEKRLQKLGSDKPVCCLCGYADPISLIKADRTLLEKHHLAGRHEGPIVPLCRNCHAELTEIQQSEDRKFNAPERSPLEAAAAFLEGLAVVFRYLAESLAYLANWLFELNTRVEDGTYEGLPYPLGRGVSNG